MLELDGQEVRRGKVRAAPQGQEKNRFDQKVALKNRLNWEGHLSLGWRTLPFCPPVFDNVFSVFQDRR